MSGSALALLARRHRQTTPRQGHSLRRELRSMAGRLRAVYTQLVPRSKTPSPLPGSAEWLLDNDYVIQSALRIVRVSLPASFMRQLPREAGKSHTCIRELSDCAVDEGGSPLDMDWLAEAIKRYQAEVPLTTGELWALPAMLRLTILQRLLGQAEKLLDAQTADTPQGATIASLILSLRTLDATDWIEFVEQASLVEATLGEDPSGYYSLMDRETRDRYRRRVEILARRANADEVSVARRANALAARHPDSDRRQHVGYFLVDQGARELETLIGARVPLRRQLARAVRRAMPVLYPAGITLLTLAATAWPGYLLAGYGAAPWALLPALFCIAVVTGSMATAVVNWLATVSIAPRVLPKLDFDFSVTSDCRAAVVVPVVLGSPADVAPILARLQMNYLGNAGTALHFVLLTDLADAGQENLPGDDAVLQAVRDGMATLRTRHADGNFYWLHRARRWNEVAGQWMGWERKRGKLFDFNHFLLSGDAGQFSESLGCLDDLCGFRFVITLDADTQLPTGAAQRLLGTFAHPLNRAHFDDDGRLTAGYTIIQPRVETTPESANQTAFTRAYAGATLLDLYSTAVSDVYHDAIGSGIFAGKAVYDVAALERTLAGRVPDNAILSHDLFEGLHGRVGLASDINVFESMPANVPSYMRRQHRWVRGDWQLLPWLKARVHDAEGNAVPNRFRLIDQWKIADNLRRSLHPIALLALLLLGWTALPVSAWLWTLGWLATLAMPLWLGLAGGLVQVVRPKASTRRALAGAGWTAQQEIRRTAMAAMLLPFEAAVNLDAILRTLWRLRFARGRLLEWTPAAFAERKLGPTLGLGTVLRDMRWPLLLVAALLALAITPPVAPPLALALLVAWLLSPAGILAISTATAAAPAEKLSNDERRELRLLARRTWTFFETFVGPDSHWLPPDNVHEEPRRFTAERTSPTNIGVLLTTTLAAWDLGYLTVHGLCARLGHSLDTIERLDRHRGHLLNWYNTRTLAPLEPRYVSTVDSGNLSGALLVVASGLKEARGARFDLDRLCAGLADGVALLRQALEDYSPARAASQIAASDRLAASLREPDSNAARRQALKSAQTQLLPALIQQVTELVERDYAGFSRDDVAAIRDTLGRLNQQLQATLFGIDQLLPWLAVLADRPAGIDDALARQLDSLEAPPALCDYVAWTQTLKAAMSACPANAPGADWLQEVGARLLAGRDFAEHMLKQLDWLSARCRRLAGEADFAFLYDSQRHLFHIGYNVSSAQFDANHYDLLASEARLASYIAIAMGQVPVKHWVQLGRPFTRIAGRRVLVSWSATAFEYLMPSLFMATPRQGLLAQSCAAAVRRQQLFGRQHDIPWGISESSFYELDEQFHFQYHAFGVPGLGLRRETAFRLVVSPYASLLALPYAPSAVVSNLRRLKALHAVGRYGAFEAVDFGDPGSRSPARVVTCYMSHHQGMIMTAVDNALFDNRMLQRFHANPDMRHVDYLLYERLPPGVPRKLGFRSAGRREADTVTAPAPQSWVPDSTEPAVNALSNGTLHSVVSAGGAMTLMLGNKRLTRGQLLATAATPSRRLYLLDGASGEAWTLGEPQPGHKCRVEFAPHRVQLHHEGNGLRCRLDIVVAPDANVEVQRLTLHNTTPHSRVFRAVHYAEPVLCVAADDERHPGFNKLFIEASMAADDTLLFRRRLRGSQEEPVYFGQALLAPEDARSICVTDREAFLGAGGSYRNPAGLPGAPTGLFAVQASLDPAAAIGAEIELHADQSVELYWLTAAGAKRGALLDSLANYRQRQHANWAFWHAQFASERGLRDIGLQADRVPGVMRLMSRLLVDCLAQPAELPRCRALQASLWSRGVSGDLPILLVHLRDVDNIALARDAIEAHRYLTSCGMRTDLVVVDHVSAGYSQPTRDSLQRLAEQANRHRPANEGRVVLLAAADSAGQDLRTLAAAARVVLDSQYGALAEQVKFAAESSPLPVFVPMPTGPLAPMGTAVQRPSTLLLDNGLGGFSADGRDYVLFLANGELPPQPWINVLANPAFGSLVSASGAAFTWSQNSGENRLTPWHNDPVRDPGGEVLYLRDEESGAVWSPTPRPLPAAHPYLVRHGAGYTRFCHASHSVDQSLDISVDNALPVKHMKLVLTNQFDQPRRLTATLCVEWVLGNNQHRDAPFIVSEFVHDDSALLATNRFTQQRPDATAFVATDQPVHGMTTDLTEFLGQAEDWTHPAALYRIGLSGRVDAGRRQCAALQVHIDLPPSGERTVHFVLGQADDREAALQLIRKTCGDADASLAATTALWDKVLGGCTVKTPDPAFDLLVNRRLLYQAQACRLWARAALYQCGGGLGFRDQLQDVMALCAHQPALARQQILDAAHSQFVEGDVLHWWHVDPRRGVRTRCSDDLLWLPYVTAHYISVVGDAAILDEQIAFLQAPELGPDEHERYAEFDTTSYRASLYEHCWRAIDLALGRLGKHGLPLIGSCDWNDGLSRVGIAGKGESVWMGWFLIAVCKHFVPLCEAKGDHVHTTRYSSAIERLARTVEEAGWDGEWYRRAYFDDGTPLGSATSDECRIDFNAQSWAVMSGAATPARAEQAMASAVRQLVDADERLVLLLTPPFDKTAHDPGYIKGYPPGIRENGGQYTHASIWAAWALFDLGQTGLACRVFDLLNPLARCTNRDAVKRYRVEPYVMAADVYGAAPFTGRGGWTWYTGAAGWMHRLAIEKILGLRKAGNRLTITPALPPDWPGFEVDWRHGDSHWLIRVRVSSELAPGEITMHIDGQPSAHNWVTLDDDGERHTVDCVVPRTKPDACKDQQVSPSERIRDVEA